MKRSGSLGLVLMGTAAFAATFAGGAAFMRTSKPAQAAPQTVATCTPGPGQNCDQARRGFMPVPIPISTKSAAQTGAARSASDTTRGGFGATSQNRRFRVAAGG